MKRAYIVHGWGATPESDWIPWLNKELSAQGWNVTTPTLPETVTPHIDTWVPALTQSLAINGYDEETILVGHSLGCQTIVRALERLPEGARVHGLVLVGGFFVTLTNNNNPDEDVEIAREWLTTPISWEHVCSKFKKAIAHFSDDDRYVPLINAPDMKERLGATIIIEHNMGHYTGSEGFTKVPSILHSIESIVKDEITSIA